MSRCFHRTNWVIGTVEWCYACGAVRGLGVTAIEGEYGTRTVLSPSTPWQKPVGQTGANPWELFERRTLGWEKRMRKINSREGRKSPASS